MVTFDMCGNSISIVTWIVHNSDFRIFHLSPPLPFFSPSHFSVNFYVRNFLFLEPAWFSYFEKMFFLVNPASYSSPAWKWTTIHSFFKMSHLHVALVFDSSSTHLIYRRKPVEEARCVPYIDPVLSLTVPLSTSFSSASYPARIIRPPLPLVFPTPCPTFSHVQSVKSIHTNSLWRSLLFFNVHGDKTQVKNISLSRKLLYLLWNFEVGVQRRILKSIDNFFSRKCLNIMNINHTFLATGP